MRRTDPRGILAAAIVAVALVATPAGAEGWKEFYDAGLKARIAGDHERAELLMKRALAAGEAPEGAGRMRWWRRWWGSPTSMWASNGPSNHPSCWTRR